MEEHREKIEAIVRKCTDRLNGISEEQIQSLIDRLSKMKDMKSVVDSLALSIEKFFARPEQKEQYDASMQDILELSEGIYNSVSEIEAQAEDNKSKNYTPGNISLEENHELINDTLKKVCDKLNELGVDYYVVGALSSFIGTQTPLFRYHGDIDFMVAEKDISKVSEALKGTDYDFSDDRLNNEKRLEDGVEHTQGEHEVIANHRDNEFHLGFFMFRREKDNSITVREYFMKENENGTKVPMVLERNLPQELVDLEYTQEQTEYAGTHFRTSTPESVYAKKMFTRHPKDMLDIEALKSKIDERKIEEMQKYQTTIRVVEPEQKNIEEDIELQNFNYHTHTSLCGHASGTMEEYIKKAIEGRITNLGFSDHMPIPSGKENPKQCMNLTQFHSEYIPTLEELREKYKDQIDIKIGLECEYYGEQGEQHPQLQKFREETESKLDYMILGQHFVFKRDEKGQLKMPPEMSSKTSSQYPLDYAMTVVEAMKSGKFAYVAHPDIFLEGRDGVPDEEKDLYMRNAQEATQMICEAASKYQIPLEVNLGSISTIEAGIKDKMQDGSYAYPVPEFWKVAQEYGCQVLIGMDAHSPEALKEKDSEIIAKRLLKNKGIELNYMDSYQPRGIEQNKTIDILDSAIEATEETVIASDMSDQRNRINSLEKENGRTRDEIQNTPNQNTQEKE